MRGLTWLAVLLAAAGCAGLPGHAPRLDGITYSRMESVAADVPLAIHVLTVDLTRPGIEL